MLFLIGLHQFSRFNTAVGDTGEVSLREVTATFVREVDHINYLTIIDEFGNEQVIATTDSHPFWVVTDEPDLERAARGTVDENGVWLYHENIGPTENGFWVEAKDLREGDVFLGANGELLTLVSQERVEFEESITVYNFTVDGNHNYFVIAAEDEYGQTCVLVHNAGYDPNLPPTKGLWNNTPHPKTRPSDVFLGAPFIGTEGYQIFLDGSAMAEAMKQHPRKKKVSGVNTAVIIFSVRTSIDSPSRFC